MGSVMSQKRSCGKKSVCLPIKSIILQNIINYITNKLHLLKLRLNLFKCIIKYYFYNDQFYYLRLKSTYLVLLSSNPTHHIIFFYLNFLASFLNFSPLFFS